MTAKDVQNWTPQQWNAMLTYACPSGGGAVGVVFAWGGRARNPQDYAKPATADFVIKPIRGSASPTKFAEFALNKIGGASSPHSKPIARKSPAGDALVSSLKKFRVIESDPARTKRWGEVMHNYDGADYFLIQETQTGIAEFGDVYREQRGLIGLLHNQQLMTNIGKLFAADAFIGNGDRLCKPNMGNIVFKPNGTISSIDSATVLTNFEAVVSDSTNISWSADFWQVQNPATWAKDDIIVSGGGAIPGQGQTFSPPTFSMATLFKPDDWWDNTFKKHLLHGISVQAQDNRTKNLPAPLPPTPPDWVQAKTWFIAGLEEGLRAIDSRLGGFSWLNLKSKFKHYEKKYGKDANLDWTNLKIRRRFFKAMRSGRSEQVAIADVIEYVKRKFPDYA